MADVVRAINKKPWTKHVQHDARVQGAIELAKLVVGATALYEPHRREILSIAIWKASEASSKMNPRFRSRGVVDGELGTPVNHEHVVTRRFLVDAMIAAPENVKHIMDLAIGCLVTRDEHKCLSRTKEWGWMRYLEAGVDVIDGASHQQLDLGKAHGKLKAFADELGLFRDATSES